jgi:uncharacterized protein (DUF924 family)
VVVKPAEILEFWFGDALVSADLAKTRAKLWFSRNDEFDREIERRFGLLPESAAHGELDAWREDASSALALVLVLDQFPRNLFRKSPRAFAFDSLAREVALEAISRKFDEALPPLQASFLYLPLEHAEDIELQERSVQLFERLFARAPADLHDLFGSFADYARRHRDIVRRFGRFAHRNDVLGRPSTPEEAAYLESGGDRFG